MKKILILYLFSSLTLAAETYKDNRSIAYAKYHLAELYAEQQRYDEAIQLTRQAIFYAQLYPEFQNDPALLSRLERRLGQYFYKIGKTEKAIDAYKLAVKYLQQVLEGYRYVSPSFRKMAENVYFELADLLLQAAKSNPRFLKEAIDNIELFKQIELQNYFKDECVTQLKEKLKAVDRILSADTAIFYPIVLHNRVELLLTFHDGHQQFETNMTPTELRQAATNFREKLQSKIHLQERLIGLLPGVEIDQSNDYHPYAQQLYRGLFVKPIIEILNKRKIETLVIIPPSILLNIPFAALHDGDKYLIQRYALAITPGWELTDPRKFKLHKIKALLNGLAIQSQNDKNFPPLENAIIELENIYNWLGTGDKLANEKFTISEVHTRFTNTAYSIVHFATHGNFDSNPNKNFLLTYDGKLSLNKLEKMFNQIIFRDKPVELLTLSACESARGAELGLAGVAIKAGARSVLATLWSVNDVSTQELITEFYKQLVNGQASKAKTLQKAQLSLIETENYKDPYFWAPFILIGNWL